jgi:general secretion pathway protein A
LLDIAGNPGLMTTELKATVAEHAAGNYRVMMNIADELLVAAAERNLPQLDEKLYFDLFQMPASSGKRAVGKNR